MRSSYLWLPSFGFIFFLVIELGLFGHPSRVTDDPAAARHLRTGEMIVATGKIPLTNPLGFVQPPLPWIDFEWAFETCLGWLEKMGGLAWPFVFCYTIFAATNLSVYRMLVKDGLSLFVVLIFSVLVYLTLHLQFAMRPLLFTYLFMALLMEVWWARPLYPARRDWFSLPLIFIAWANLHSGWLAALLFLGMSLAGRCLDRIFCGVKAKDAPLLPWVGLTVLCALGTLLNPWSWRMQVHELAMTTSYKSFALWQEDNPPNFADPSFTALVVLFLLLILFLARLLKAPPLWRWENILPFFCFFYFGLKAQRHVLLLILVAAVPVARDLEALLSTRPTSALRTRLDNFQAMQRQAGADGWLVWVSIILVSVIFVSTVKPKKLQVSTLDRSLITFLKQHPDRFHRPLTTTANGGPLLWQMRPDFRVSFDDRGDLYGDAYVFQMIDLEKLNGGWRKNLDAGHYDSALLDSGLPLAHELSQVPGWVKVYETKDTSVFWRNEGSKP